MLTALVIATAIALGVHDLVANGPGVVAGGHGGADTASPAQVVTSSSPFGSAEQ